MPDHMDPMPSDDSDPMIVQMQMSLDASTRLSVLLFKNWNIDSGAQFLGAVMAIVALALTTETLAFIMKMKLKRDDGTRNPLYSVLYYLLKFLNYM